jgi:hypothetical protein
LSESESPFPEEIDLQGSFCKSVDSGKAPATIPIGAGEGVERGSPALRSLRRRVRQCLFDFRFEKRACEIKEEPTQIVEALFKICAHR